MSDTTNNPVEQDPEARASRVRLHRFLSVLRILAGRRGYANVEWWGQGFRYTLTAERVPPGPTTVDADPTIEDVGAYVRWLRALLLRTDRGEDA